MSQMNDVHEILFSQEELFDKKRITTILVKNKVDFYPVRNVRDEYKTTIRMRTPTPDRRSPTPEKKSPITKLDKDTKSKVDGLIALMALSSQKKEKKYEEEVIEEMEYDPQSVPTSNKIYASLTSNTDSNREPVPKKTSSKNLISDFTLPETASQMNSTQSVSRQEREKLHDSYSKEKDLNKLIENVKLEENHDSKAQSDTHSQKSQKSQKGSVRGSVKESVKDSVKASSVRGSVKESVRGSFKATEKEESQHNYQSDNERISIRDNDFDSRPDTKTDSHKEYAHESQHGDEHEDENYEEHEIEHNDDPKEDSLVRNLDDPPLDSVRDIKNTTKFLQEENKIDVRSEPRSEAHDNEILEMAKQNKDSDAKSNSSSSVKTPTLGKSKNPSQPGSDYGTKNPENVQSNEPGPRGENFSSIPSSSKSNTESLVSLGEKKQKKKGKAQASKFSSDKMDNEFARQAQFLMAITKDDDEPTISNTFENTAKFQTEPVEAKSAFSSASNKNEFNSKGKTNYPQPKIKQEFQSARGPRKENLPESVKLKKDREIIFIPDEGNGVIITEEIFRILMPNMEFSKFLTVLKRKGLKFYQIPGRKSNSPQKFMESLVIDPNSSFLSDFHPAEHGTLSKNLYPRNWTPNSLGSFLFPHSGSQSPKSRGKSYSPAKKNDSWNDNYRPKSARPLYRPKLKPSRDSSAELNREIADLINSKQLSEAIKEIEEQPSNLVKSKEIFDINFSGIKPEMNLSGMKPVFVVDSDNFYANYVKEQEEYKLYKAKLKEHKYDTRHSQSKIEKLIKNTTASSMTKMRQAEENFKFNYYAALGHIDSNIERPDSFRSSKQYDKMTPEKNVESEQKHPESARRAEPDSITKSSGKKKEPVKIDNLIKNFEKVAEESRKKTERLFETFKKKELPRHAASPPRKNTSIDNMNSQELISYHATIANKAKHMTLLRNSKYYPKEKFFEPVRRKVDH